MVSDAVRYSINSLQSIHAIRSPQLFPKLSAWQLIKAYYAAFFAAHSTLRLFGKPFSYFETGHCSAISKKAVIENSLEAAQIKTGNYYASFDSNRKTVSFTNHSDSHKDLWKEYGRFLKNMSTKIIAQRGTQEDLIEISTFLSGVVRLLQDEGRYSANNWLSVVRNEVNYHSTAQVWYPYAKNNIRSEDVFSKASGWKSGQITVDNCQNSKDQYEKFFLTCMLVSQFSRELIVDYNSVAHSKCRYASRGCYGLVPATGAAFLSMRQTKATT